MRKEDLNLPAIDSAIRTLRPGVERWDYVHNIQTFSIWEDSQGREPPTHDEIMQQVILDANRLNYYNYVIRREDEYGLLKDQIEMLYKDIKNGNILNGEFVSFIDNIREKYPKPDISFEEWTFNPEDSEENKNI